MRTVARHMTNTATTVSTTHSTVHEISDEPIATRLSPELPAVAPAPVPPPPLVETVEPQLVETVGIVQRRPFQHRSHRHRDLDHTGAVNCWRPLILRIGTPVASAGACSSCQYIGNSNRDPFEASSVQVPCRHAPPGQRRHSHPPHTHTHTHTHTTHYHFHANQLDGGGECSRLTPAPPASSARHGAATAAGHLP